MNEKWRPVFGYESRYQVSNKGSVRSIERKGFDLIGRPYRKPSKILAQQVHDAGGYLSVGLSKNNRVSTRLVHHLVLEAFGTEPRLGRETRHLDSDPTNNAIENLEWGSSNENQNDKKRRGTTRFALKRGMCANGHAWTSENLLIRANGTPVCKFCRRANERRRYHAAAHAEATA
jgi:hypothetical protein